MSATNACNYLDINPEQGISEEDVFSSYKNAKAFFDTVYDGDYSSGDNQNILLGFPLYLDFHALRWSWYDLTDAADCGRLVRSQSIRLGNLGSNTTMFLTFEKSRRPIADVMFRLIRICNKTITNIDMLKNAKPEEKTELLAEAYFVRGFCHFVLVRYFGGMPYINKVLTGDDSWDMARLPAAETLRLCAEDFDKAYELFAEIGLMRRDALPGQPGHLDGVNMDHPTGVIAKSFKARALLYAASPLNNLNGKADWEDAAIACAEAIELAEMWQYELLPAEKWNDNFYGPKYNNEAIWLFSNRQTNKNGNYSGLYCLPQSQYSNAGGTCPTQNFVDKFETADGYPLNTEADRQRAIAAGSYKDQDPYSNRDPRFYKTIVYDGCITTGAPGGINIYYDPATKKYPTTSLDGTNQDFGIAWGTKDSKGYSCTGYYLNKCWDGRYGTAPATNHTDPLIRLAELYLNYAEAVNEAYGPRGTAGNLTLTAVDAINKIRRRVNMPDVKAEFTTDTDTFRDRIRNERNVELAYEGHHYYLDIRRWKIAPETMTQTLMGMYIEKVNVSTEYPKGRKYTRTPLPANRQSTWKNAMYYIPFPIEEANKMQNFVNNEIW